MSAFTDWPSFVDPGPQHRPDLGELTARLTDAQNRPGDGWTAYRLYLTEEIAKLTRRPEPRLPYQELTDAQYIRATFGDV